MQIWSTEIKELETLYTSIKGGFPELQKELEQLIETKDANVVMLYSRRCLEVIITDLCESELQRPRKTEPLKGIIDKLNKEEKVPSYIITSMDHLNSLSTFGAHPKEYDPEQVRPILLNLATIFKWYIKYKDIKIENKANPEEKKYGNKGPDDSAKYIGKSKKRLIVLYSGLLLVVIVIMILFVFNIVGDRKSVSDKPESEKSIAVLPFKNFSTDPDQEYMSDGLTDEIINHLYKIASFDKVVSLNSVLTYKGTDKKIPQIADELKVNYILEGTYKKIGDSVRVTTQLIDPKNDRHLWQHEYDQPYKEIISIQADIALQIANNVKAFLTKSELENIQKISTSNLEAYEFLQRAFYLMRTGGNETETTNQILDLALKAIELDPDYADAYGIAGIVTLSAGAYAGSKEISSAIWDALPFFEKALELDQNNAWAHFGMGNINEWGRWDYITAEKEYLKVNDLGTNRLETSWDYYIILIGEFFLKMNRLEDALIYQKKAQELAIAGYTDLLIKIKVLSGNKNEAYSSIRKIYQDSGEEMADSWKGEECIWWEKYDTAKIYLESDMSLPKFLACLALAYYKTKNYQQAQVINQLIDKSNETTAGSPEYFTGWYYSGIGEVDSAFYWLEKAFKKRSPEFPFFKVDPVFKNLKGDDRYWDLYERTGHKAYDEYMAEIKK
jgi:TolB-like protein